MESFFDWTVSVNLSPVGFNLQQAKLLSVADPGFPRVGQSQRRKHQPLITGRKEVVAKVMFLLVSVILSGGVSASVHAGIPPPRNRHPLGADTPQSRHPLEQTPPSLEQTPGVDTPSLEQTPHQEQTPPRSRHPPPRKQTPAYGQ